MRVTKGTEGENEAAKIFEEILTDFFSKFDQIYK
jgi:hypothetical protein